MKTLHTNYPLDRQQFVLAESLNFFISIKVTRFSYSSQSRSSNPPMPSKLSKKSTAPSKRKAVTQEPPPNWPPLQPLVPPTDLSLETLLDDQILVVHNLLTSTLCRNYVSFLSSLPLVTTPGQPKKDEALRVNDRYVIDDPKFTEMLWNSTALKGLVTGSVGGNSENESPDAKSFSKLWGGEVLGLNPRIRIYRYGKGQFFGQHCK